MVATDERLWRQRGSALAAVLVMVVLVALLSSSLLVICGSEARSAAASRERLAAFYAALSGIERQVAAFREIQRKTDVSLAFEVVDALAGVTTFDRETLTKDGVSIAQYTVEVLSVAATSDLIRDVTVRSTAWVPSAAAAKAQQHHMTAVVRVELVRSNLFDYVYFIHNWGRLYGDKILVDGNARSNGRFDCGNYKAKIQGVPRFESVNGSDLIGYLDDNGDGVKGNDGGIYSTWDINADSVFGQAGEKWSEGDWLEGRCDFDEIGKFKNQHEWWPPIMPLPTLTDLSLYEARAKANNSWIKVGDTVVCGPVLGDDYGEPQNLYLRGTADAPIWINGSVVVRGNVMVSGVVKGKGQIFASGNIYVPQNLQYETKPQPLPRPGSRNESELENWLLHNKYDTDFLGLFAQGNIVVGDFTNAAWQQAVAQVLANPRNMTREDAGIDCVPNTKAGRDGIESTADDDTLEADDIWTVERYTQADAEAGLIPPGLGVGDPIPGSGEDLDGDGQYDGSIRATDFALSVPLSPAYWAGNLAAPVPSVSDIATTNIYRLDGAFYTNHAFAMAALSRTNVMEFNGCLIARYEGVYYDVKDMIMNYDYRLMAGDQFGFELPKTWAPVRTLLWQSGR